MAASAWKYTAVLALTIVVTKATPISEGSISFDELLNADGIFKNQVLLSQFPTNGVAGKDSALIEALEDFLNEPAVLHQLYIEYKHTFEESKDIEGTIDLFKSRLINIARHNLEARRGLHTWEKGVNQFTDITEEEFEKYYTGYNSESLYDALKNSSIPQVSPNLSPSAPSTMDWKQKGKVGSVKNQKRCSSCVMFASAAVIESAVAVKSDDSVTDLSPQQLLDCAQSRDVCKQGSAFAPVMDYAKKNGLATIQKYPLNSSGNKQSCQSGNTGGGAKISSWSSTRGESQLKESVANAPVETGIYHPPSDYKKGVYDGCPRGGKHDHAILVVGYGNQGSDFWLIKNSWGSSWGDGGYYMLKRGSGSCAMGTDMNIVVNA